MWRRGGDAVHAGAGPRKLYPDQATFPSPVPPAQHEGLLEEPASPETPDASEASDSDDDRELPELDDANFFETYDDVDAQRARPRGTPETRSFWSGACS